MQVEAWALLPAHNEGPRLGTVIEGLELPVLVVDDRSEDDTAEVARDHGATVIASQRSGYAGTIATGHRWLRDQGIYRCVQLDADGQHPTHEAQRLLAALDGANWVIGSRQGTRSPTSLRRRLGSAALGASVRALTGLALKDVTSGFWACDETAIALLAQLDGDVADANLRVLAWRRGLLMRELPVDMAARSEGTSMHDGWRGLANMGRSLRAMAQALG